MGKNWRGAVGKFVLPRIAMPIMPIFAALLYFVWIALWLESVRYGVFLDAPPITNPPKLGRVPELKG